MVVRATYLRQRPLTREGSLTQAFKFAVGLGICIGSFHVERTHVRIVVFHVLHGVIRAPRHTVSPSRGEHE